MSKEQAIFEICVVIVLVCNGISNYLENKRIRRIETYLKYIEPWNKWFE